MCAKKILDRLAEYEQLENLLEPCRNLYVPDFEDEPDLNLDENELEDKIDEDSPPFEPAASPIVSSSPRIGSPILSRSSYLDNYPAVSIQETPEISLKPKSFIFKKPVSKPLKSDPIVVEEDEDPIYRINCDKPDKTPYKGFDFNAPGPSNKAASNSTFSGPYTPTTFSG